VQLSINDSVLGRFKSFFILLKRSDQFAKILLKVQQQSFVRNVKQFAEVPLTSATLAQT
jgi:hypothetical protein